MNEVAVKLRYIYARYLLISIGTVFLYSLFRWYFDYKLGIIPLKEDLLDYWIPCFLPIIPILIWLRKPLLFLNIKWSDDNGFFFYQLIAGLTIIIPTVISQEYIKASNSRLISVESPYDIIEAKGTNFYVIENFDIKKEHTGGHSNSRTSGNYDEKLNFTIYMVVPMIDNSVSGQFDLKNHKHWYGFKFTDETSNRSSDDAKKKHWKTFYEESIKKYERFQYFDFEYLRGLSNSDDRDGYLEAVKSIRESINMDNLLILEPVNEPFVQNAETKFWWIFGSFGIGAFVFLIMILIPSVNYGEFGKFERKEPLSNDDLNGYLDFIIPKGDHFVAAILMDVNLIIFVCLVLSGVNVISATPSELLTFGAIRRFEVMNGELWRLFTSMFLHGGLMHLGMNLFAIAIICYLVEASFGRIKTILAYVISGIGASVGSIFWYENTVSVGASGAIFGMMGVMIAHLIVKKTSELNGLFVTILVLYGGINLALGFLGGVDNAAHIGGLLTGTIIGFVLLMMNKEKSYT